MAAQQPVPPHLSGQGYQSREHGGHIPLQSRWEQLRAVTKEEPLWACGQLGDKLPLTDTATPGDLLRQVVGRRGHHSGGLITCTEGLEHVWMQEHGRPPQSLSLQRRPSLGQCLRELQPHPSVSGLNAAHHYSSARMSWDALLKYSGMEIECHTNVVKVVSEWM